MCALRKYQYKFKLQMGSKDIPLLTREDLIGAITRHFATKMKVDYQDEIGKFLSFKREEARPDLTFPGVRRQGRLNRRAAARQNVNNGANGATTNGAGAANGGGANGAQGPNQSQING